MKSLSIFVIAIAAVLGVLAGSAGVGSAQVKQGKTRPLLTSQLMSGIVKAHSGSLKDALACEPMNDKAWEDVRLHAAILNEASYTLMDDGRCPDSVWADAAVKNMRKGSEGVLAAVEKKDLSAAKAAADEVGKSCGGCHKKHKPKSK